jgi:hypothetical protein
MPGGFPEYEVTVVLTRKELIDAFHGRPREWRQQEYIRAVLTAVALVAIAAVSHLGAAGIVGGVLIFTIYWVLRFQITALMPTARRALAYRFDSTGIDITVGQRHHGYPWSQVRAVTRTDDAVVLWLTRRVAFILPYRCFASANDAAAIASAVDAALR